MKYLVLIAIVVLVLWFWRKSQHADEAPRKKPAPPGSPQEMVQCPVCMVRLPRADALSGPDGQVYCCNEHSAAGER